MPDKSGFKSFLPFMASGMASLTALFLLSGCISKSGAAISVSGEKSEKASNEAFIDLRAYCPKIAVRTGAKTMRIYPKGITERDVEAKQKLRFQASINEFTRECNYMGDRLAIRVGVAGIVINGPAGETGLLKLPVRVSVNRGKEILYSRTHQISTTLEKGKNHATFRFIEEDINIAKPEHKNLQINIGFDNKPS